MARSHRAYTHALWLDLYRAALSRCENFVTLPHGGIRKRGGTDCR